MAASSTVQYFSKDYHNARENIIFLFWKYLADIKSETWLDFFWEYRNLKLFAVRLLSLSFPFIPVAALFSSHYSLR